MQKKVTINLAEKRGRQRVNIVQPERDIERKSLRRPPVLPGADPLNDRDCVPQQSGPWTGSPCDQITDPGGTVVAWVPPCSGSTTTATRLYFSTDGLSSSVTTDSAFGNDGDWFGATFGYDVLKTFRDGTIGTAGKVDWSAVNAGLGNYGVRGYGFQLVEDDGILEAAQVGGSIFAQVRARSRFGIGISEASQDNVLALGARIFRVGTGFVGAATPVATAGSLKFPAQATPFGRSGDGTVASVSTAQAGDWLILELGAHHNAPITGGTGASIFNTNDQATDLPAGYTGSAALNSWVEFTYTVDNDCPPPAAPGFVTGGREINQVASRLSPNQYEICVQASEILAVRVDGFLLFGWTWDGDRTITLPYSISDELEVTVQYIA